jgi:hypothetical protein
MALARPEQPKNIQKKHMVGLEEYPQRDSGNVIWTMANDTMN